MSAAEGRLADHGQWPRDAEGTPILAIVLLVGCLIPAPGPGVLRACVLLTPKDHLRAAEDLRSERGPRPGGKPPVILGREMEPHADQVNATPSDEAGIGDELGIMGVRDPGFRVLTYEMSIAQR
jgi:hypothetical protein